MSRRDRNKEQDESVVAITPDLLATLDPGLRAALEIALDKQKVAEQEREIAKLKEDMYIAAGALLEAGCVHVLNADGFEPEVDPLPTGFMYHPLSVFFHDLYGSDFASSSFPLAMREAKGCPIVAYHPLREHPLVRYDFYRDFVNAAKAEETYIYFGTFFMPKTGYLTTKKTMMRTINGFAVDIDRMAWEDDGRANMDYYITVLIKKLKQLPEVLQPNYILLSGTAAQLWYIFDEPVVLQSKKSPRRKRFDHLYEQLYRFFARELPKNACKVDIGCANINHPFRAPYSLSKYGFPTALYKWSKNGKTDVLALSDVLDAGLTELDVIPIDKELYDRITEERESEASTEKKYATEKQLAFISNLNAMNVLSDDEVEDAGDMSVDEADSLIKKGLVKLERVKELHENGGIIHTSAGRDIRHKPRHPKFYENTLARMKEETKPGSRYHALFVLACTAWNCNIPKARLERDMRELQNSDWGMRGGHDGKPVTDSDIKSALLGYTPLAALRKRWHNETLLEWNYAPSAKRNHQTRWTHLQADEWVINGKRKVNTCKENRERNPGGRPQGTVKGKTKKGEQIKAFAAEHPEMSNRKIAEALGVSRNTVNKWLKG